MFWDPCENCEATRSSANREHTMDDALDSETNGSQAKYTGDLSMYDSPSRMSCDGSPQSYRRLLDDYEESRDSGYSACETSSKSSSPKSRILSFGSCVSMDEASLDITELEQENESASLPGNFNLLITGPIAAAAAQSKKSPDIVTGRGQLRRAFSLITNTTPVSSRARSCLFKDPVEAAESRNFKRPEPPAEIQSPLHIKKCRILGENAQLRHIAARPIYQRSFSATEDSIKSAVMRSATEKDLIGDFSKSFCLPLIPGRHQDLKSISPATLAKLMRGEFENVNSFKIIDCRYPYEYEGGHILGALNIYTMDQIEELIKGKTNEANQENHEQSRHILVFHCEFSSKRGPTLSRGLRQVDRDLNKDVYPYLNYPEIYLLHGGYKEFYENSSELCTPSEYLPMLHPDHEQNLRHFRAKSKTWNAGRFKRI